MSLKNSLMIATLALMAGCLAGYWLGHLQGEIREKQLNEAQAHMETERLEKALQANRDLHHQLSELQTGKQKEEENARRKYDALLARIDRGTVRVSIPVRACGGVSAGGRAADADRKSRAELDAEVVERILAVGRDGDAAIRNLNQCIDQYQAVAKACGQG